jgi:hypothetical protein
MPVYREWLIILVKAGKQMERQVLKKGIGIGSRSQKASADR